ncbi:MAG TPA: hypothetical protein VI685_05200 [Candidatus Angelobacter sp.]
MSSLLALALIFCLLPPAASAADLKIVTRQSINDHDSATFTQYLTASRSRFESGRGIDNIAGHRIASIVHHGDTTNRNFTLDLDAHEYTVHETDKRGIQLGAKSYPAKYAGGQLDIWIESTDTGDRQEMFGHTARHIITKDRRVPGPGACSQGSEAEYDGWYIDYSVLPEWRRPTPGVFAIVAGFSGGCRDKIQVHRSGVELGFPIKVITTQTQHAGDQRPDEAQKVLSTTSLLEVIEFSEAPLDPALFEVPADFRQVKELTRMTHPQSLTAWARFKGWLTDIFR